MVDTQHLKCCAYGVPVRVRVGAPKLGKDMFVGIYILLGIIFTVLGYVGYEVYKLIKMDLSIGDIDDLD